MDKNKKPSMWFSKLLKVFVAEEIVEELEGDMLENYHWRLKESGRIRAKLHLLLDVLTLYLLPTKYLTFNIGKFGLPLFLKKSWIPLSVISGLILLMAFEPMASYRYVHTISKRVSGKSNIMDVSPVISVKEMEPIIGFYEERLGFRQIYSSKDYQEGPLDFVIMCRENACINFQLSENTDQTSMPQLRLRAHNLDALFKEFKGKGTLSNDASIQTQAWGTREFALYDPNKVSLTFFEVL